MHTGVQSFAKVKSALSQVNPTPKVCVCVCVMTSYCVLCYVYIYFSMTRDLVKRIPPLCKLYKYKSRKSNGQLQCSLKVKLHLAHVMRSDGYPKNEQSNPTV